MIQPSDRDLVAISDEVLASVPETIVQVDADFRIRAVNRTGSPIFRHDPAPGDRLDEVFRGRVVGEIARLIDQAQSTGLAETEADTGTELFWVTAKKLESAPLTVLVIQNRTTLMHAEKEAVSPVGDRSSFLSSVSRELRTPLTSVLGYANLLAEPDPDLNAESRTTMVQEMTGQAWELARIVEDLLAMARAEIGELRVASVPVNLRANVAQVIESMGGRGTDVGVTGYKTITGLGDPARFRQIVRNLLSNALTHGSEPIRLEVLEDGDYAVLRVWDRGPGVAGGLAESTFDAGGDSYAPGRVGIGLWISRELATLMGGRLIYRREGGETLFQVTIPR